MKYLIIFITLFLSLPAFSQECSEIVDSLKWINKANPVVDANKALQQGNYKYYAVYGDDFVIPGMSYEVSKSIINSNNYLAIEGTGDDMCSSEHLNLNIKAYKYAEHYNQAIHKKKGLRNLVVFCTILTRNLTR